MNNWMLIDISMVIDNAVEFQGKKTLFQTTVIGKGKTEMGKMQNIWKGEVKILYNYSNLQWDWLRFGQFLEVISYLINGK